MEEMSGKLFGLLLIILMFLVPLWLVLHFHHKNKVASSTLSEKEQARLIELEYESAHLIERIEALEKILQDLDPNWQQD